ncbi:hypothetical protein Barb4_01106 [Bacteroidales bacterium Barb4]|nr:hypothetical protein Barb4_01106 [Bacteroidales bacterium Barb4]
MCHAGEQYFACTATFGFGSPCEEVFAGRDAPAVEVAEPFAVGVFGIDGDNADLTAEVFRDLLNQFGTAQGGGVYGHLVRTGTEQAVNVFQFIDAAAYGEGYADVGCHLFHQFGKRLPPFVRGGYVQIDQFVGTVAAVAGTQFDGVARIAEVNEVHALHRCSVFNIQAGDYSFGKHFLCGCLCALSTVQ